MMTKFSKSIQVFKSTGLIASLVFLVACSNSTEKHDQVPVAEKQNESSRGEYQIINGKRIFVYNSEYVSGEKSQIHAGDSVMLYGGEFKYLKQKTGKDTLTVYVNEIGDAKPIGQYAIFDFKSGNKKKYYAFTLYYFNSYNGYLRSELLEFPDDPKYNRDVMDCPDFIKLDSNLIFRKK